MPTAGPILNDAQYANAIRQYRRRWPGTTGVPIEQYVHLWEWSCEEIGAAGLLPKRLADLLGLPRPEP